ncbi:hypothetical protein AB0H81_42165, partial [Nonomuraea sp. NPDC050691]
VTAVLTSVTLVPALLGLLGHRVNALRLPFLGRPITRATAAARGLAPVTVPVTGTRTGTWPGEVRFRGLPASGADITLRVAGPGPVRVTAIAETDGLRAVPGFTAMPPSLVASTREDGGLMAVTRTAAF